jgi:hypothetical protein
VRLEFIVVSTDAQPSSQQQALSFSKFYEYRIVRVAVVDDCFAL